MFWKTPGDSTKSWKVMSGNTRTNGSGSIADGRPDQRERGPYIRRGVTTETRRSKERLCASVATRVPEFAKRRGFTYSLAEVSPKADPFRSWRFHEALSVCRMCRSTVGAL